MTSERCIRVTVRGHVQGVFYRSWTVSTARELGVNGWVRNVEDGTVDALLCGPAASVDRLIEAMHSGPEAARVEAVDTVPTDEDCAGGFEKRPTIPPPAPPAG